MSKDNLIELENEYLRSQNELNAEYIESLKDQVKSLKSELEKKKKKITNQRKEIARLHEKEETNNIGLPIKKIEETIKQMETCDHEYPFPWGATIPPFCKKCGKQAEDIWGTWTETGDIKIKTGTTTGNIRCQADFFGTAKDMAAAQARCHCPKCQERREWNRFFVYNMEEED